MLLAIFLVLVLMFWPSMRAFQSNDAFTARGARRAVPRMQVVVQLHVGYAVGQHAGVALHDSPGQAAGSGSA